MDEFVTLIFAFVTLIFALGGAKNVSEVNQHVIFFGN